MQGKASGFIYVQGAARSDAKKPPGHRATTATKTFGFDLAGAKGLTGWGVDGRGSSVGNGGIANLLALPGTGLTTDTD